MNGLRRALIALAAAGLVVGLVTAALIVGSGHVSPRGLWVAVALLVGWSFIGTGLWAWARRPDNRIGALMAAVGFTWFLTWLDSANGAPLVTAGLLLGSVYLAVGVHLLLAYPSGRLAGRVERTLAWSGYAIATVGALPVVLFFDFQAAGCDCPQALLLIEGHQGLGQLMADLQNVLGGAVALATGAVLFGRWRSATAPQRRALAPLLWTGVVTALCLALLFLTTTVGFPEAVPATLYLVSLATFGAVPFAFLAGLVRIRFFRTGAITDLLARVNETPGRGALRDTLSRALGDPSLALAYWLPSRKSFVDSDGRAVHLPAADSGRAVTEVEREGRRIGAIVHDRSLCEEGELVASVASAVALALENERLEAELRARVEELRSSRSRLVEAQEDERRRLERDLHDGAQQRLVALALSLRLARDRLHSDPDASAELLGASLTDLEGALAELRELARGIHPAVLSDRGLDAALAGLARRSPLPVEVVAVPERRLPAPVESAAYFVVAEALTNVARYAGATRAEVSVVRRNGTAVVEVRDDGAGGADPDRGSGLRGLEDRVAALDGSLEVNSPPGEGTVIRAEIPCA